MSTGRGMVPVRGRASRRAEAGFTFIEMAIGLVLVALMALVVERTLASTHDAERHLHGIRRATERGQRLAYEIRDAVRVSRKLFQADAVGNGYMGALDLTRDPMLSSARLPLFDELGGLGPDTPGDPRTGNVLLFVRESDAAPTVANAATRRIRYIDTYRFICVYPSQTTRYIVHDRPNERARDLVLWRSEAFPSASQISGIQDPLERQSVVQDLYNRFGYDLAWDPSAPVGDAFFALDALGNIAGSATTGVTIDEDQNLSERGRLVYANVQLGPTDASVAALRSIFTRDNPATWVPDGFEVKVCGPSGSRKVWMHLVIEVQAAKGRVTPHVSTLIASTQDL